MTRKRRSLFAASATQACQVRALHAWLPRPRQQPIDHLVEQVVLVAYVTIERHRRPLRLGGEASDGHLLIAPGLYGLRCCCDHLLGRDRPPRGAPARCIGLLRYLGSSGRLCSKKSQHQYSTLAYVYADCLWLRTDTQIELVTREDRRKDATQGFVFRTGRTVRAGGSTSIAVAPRVEVHGRRLPRYASLAWDDVDPGGRGEALGAENPSFLHHGGAGVAGFAVPRGPRLQLVVMVPHGFVVPNAGWIAVLVAFAEFAMGSASR